MVLSALANDAAIKIAVHRIGPALVFERLWEESGCRAVIADLAGKRGHKFTHRAAPAVRERLRPRRRSLARGLWAIAGLDGLASAPLLSGDGLAGRGIIGEGAGCRTPFSPRCVKDVEEERLPRIGATRSRGSTWC
jgi:hypothetical protein